MIIETKYRPELCCSQDRTRAILLYLYLTGKFLVSTDGRRAIQIPVEREPDDVDGYVSVDSLVEARRQARRTFGKKGPVTFRLSALKDTLVFDSRFGPITVARPNPGQYPNLRQVLPEAPKTCLMNLAFNVSLLMKISEALGSDSVKLSFNDDGGGIICTAPGGGNAYAVLMPIRTS